MTWQVVEAGKVGFLAGIPTFGHFLFLLDVLLLACFAFLRTCEFRYSFDRESFRFPFWSL